MKRTKCVTALVSGANFVKAFAFLTLVAVVAGPAMAQGTSIDIPDTGISWSGIGDEIMDAIKEPLLAGIGIGIAIWLAMLAPRLLKRTAK